MIHSKYLNLIPFITLVLYIFFSYLFVESFSADNLILFILLFVSQFFLKSYKGTVFVFFMYLIWLLCYYIYVNELGIYYTDEQTFTDSNYYDYYAVKFSELPVSEIYEKANITWQSSFVITFYSLIYKYFGSNLLNPIIVNLFLLHLSFYNLKVSAIKNKQYLLIIILLLPFMALNLVVPGKDIIMFFLMTVYYSSIFNTYSKKRIFFNKIFSIIFGYLNRANTLPIFLMLEIIYFNKLKKSFKYTIIFILIILIFFIPNYIQEIMTSLGFENLIEKQQDSFSSFSSISEILLPSNPILFILMTPVRTLAYLISPFPFLSNVIDAYADRNFFVFWFVFYKFLSGLVWLIAILNFFYNKEFKYNPIINSIVLLSIFISTVYLVQGGRYRVMCDLLLISYFSYNSILKLNSNGIVFKNR